MLIKLCQAFTKLTAWPVAALCLRTKVYYEDPKVQKRHISGPAIIICNHTSVFDFAALMFVFFWRTLRCQVAELIFRKQPLGTFIKLLGGIRVDRNSHDFAFLTESEKILRKGGVVEIYPEARIPKPGEARPLEFKPSAAYLALSSGAKVIPVYTNGCYFSKKRARVIIGKPMSAGDYTQEGLSDKENIQLVNQAFREKIIALGDALHASTGKQKEKAI